MAKKKAKGKGLQRNTVVIALISRGTAGSGSHKKSAKAMRQVAKCFAAFEEAAG